ncbi:MAG: aminotransferase class IV [Verrucomicrobiota bacterium]|nr:aminotransferase class IV [Verrucomicrobiota bacterium]
MILEYSPRKKDLISPADRGFLYGDGVFETLRIYQGAPFGLEAHLELLVAGLKTLGIKIPHTPKLIGGNLLRVIKSSKIRDGFARVIVTRGESTLGLGTINCQDPKVILWAQPAPFARQTKGLKVGLSSLVLAVNKIAAVKSLNYLVNLMAKQEAEKARLDEMILCNPRGGILSGTAANLFLVSKGKLLTPSAVSIRSGVTRGVVMQIARRLKIPVLEKNLTVKDVLSADELFFTSSVSEIRWAESFVSGPRVKKFQTVISSKIFQDYRDRVAGSGGGG